MAIGLVSAKISGQAVQGTQRVTPARTSIAEDAKFITKPVKRVKFELVGGSGSNSKLLGQSNASTDIPFLGQNSGVGTSGENIATGSLGKDGLTARFNATAYSGGSGTRVKMVVNNNPQKDFSFTPTQEEGRQTNRASSTHYSQQYDSYGRPIIGFSREPYDFAATKYIAKTSQIKFQQNMQNTKNQSNDGKSATASNTVTNNDNTANTMITPPEADLSLLGEKAKGIDANFKPIVPDRYLGEKIKQESGKASTNDEVENSQQQSSESEISKALGIDFSKVLRPDNAAQATKAHDIQPRENSVSISLNA